LVFAFACVCVCVCGRRYEAVSRATQHPLYSIRQLLAFALCSDCNVQLAFQNSNAIRYKVVFTASCEEKKTGRRRHSLTLCLPQILDSHNTQSPKTTTKPHVLNSFFVCVFLHPRLHIKKNATSDKTKLIFTKMTVPQQTAQELTFFSR
jgi:hypothetical protein